MQPPQFCVSALQGAKLLPKQRQPHVPMWMNHPRGELISSAREGCAGRANLIPALQPTLWIPVKVGFMLFPIPEQEWPRSP